MDYRLPGLGLRGRGRPAHRQSIEDYYNYYPNTYQQDRQTAEEIEQDRQYAERLSEFDRGDALQIAQDHQLAIMLARERSASPRRDLDLEVALQLSRQRSVSPLRDRFVEQLDEYTRQYGQDLRRPEPEHDQQRAESPGLFVGDRDANEPVMISNDEDDGVFVTANCVICHDVTTNIDSVRIGCGHRMCRDDVGTLFGHAMTDETLFPPRCCCTHEVSVAAARDLLGDQFPPGFDARAEELRTADRTYCHVPDCSTFISARHITNDVALCPTCEEWTCTLCKQAGHRRGECPQDPAQQQLEAMAEQNGWRRCNRCRAMVELNYGCNHMTCLCGHQFCYVCGTAWRNCRCPQFEEHRLYQRAAEVAVRPRQRPLEARPNVPGQNMGPAHVIQAAPNRFVANIVPAPPRRRRNQRQHQNANFDAIEHANTLIADLNRTQQAHTRVREEAGQARARRFAAPSLRPADIDDIAAHLRANHECVHPRRWVKFHVGENRCEICQRVKRNPTVGECPRCFLQACDYCRRSRMRAGQ